HEIDRVHKQPQDNARRARKTLLSLQGLISHQKKAPMSWKARQTSTGHHSSWDAEFIATDSEISLPSMSDQTETESHDSTFNMDVTNDEPVIEAFVAHDVPTRKKYRQ